MGKHSSLGPIDPHFGGIPADGVIEEFNRAITEIKYNPSSIPLWQVIISKYHPTFIGECEKAIELAHEMVTKWLASNMFEKDVNPQLIANSVVKELRDHSKMKTHSRHLSAEKCKNDIGLKIVEIEELKDNLQDAILSVHHCYMHTFSMSRAVKIIENHNGVAMVNITSKKHIASLPALSPPPAPPNLSAATLCQLALTPPPCKLSHTVK
ncbi:periplasmic serine protease [Candidatus Magnetoovum chiemensis]|nr:periplasmic serine protease [Candidatus Magnetoovum chiemensis]